MTPAPAPGIYPNVPFGVYASWDAINASSLVEGVRSMRHLRYALTRPWEDSDSLQTGRLTHVLFYEPDAFESRYLVQPEGDGRTTAIKQAREAVAQEAAATGREVISAKQLATATAVSRAAREDSEVRVWLDAPSQTELSMVWVDALTGLVCKGRPDHVCMVHGSTWVTDLKTTQDARELEFGYSVADYYYHLKFAFYRMGLDTLAPYTRNWAWIAAEKDPPFVVKVWTVPEKLLAIGESRVRELLDRLSTCFDTNVWPAYGPAEELQPPGKIFRKR